MKFTRQKPTRCSLLSVKQLNYHDDTDQGRFLVGRRNFTILYKNPKRGDRQITQIIKPIQSSERSLQLNRGLLSVFFNFSNSLLFSLLFDFSKQSCSILNFVFMSERQSEKFDIRNKCSTICVCRILLQNIYINIQKIEL